MGTPQTALLVGRAISRWRSALRVPSLVCALGLLLTACGGTQAIPEQAMPVATLLPTKDLVVPSPTPAPPTAGEPSDSGWLEAGPGLALRRLRVPQENSLASISIVRIDPRQVRFRVGYNPGQPLGMNAWLASSGALAGINGGFFDEQNQSTALIISAGAASGESYQGRGGMFAVDAAGNVSLRYLAEQPYDPAEPFSEALQSWPMLVKPGGILAYTTEDTERARRSVVALDREGHVLLIACATSTFTLRGLADWLLASDLQIDAALNLDGGSSTALYLESATQRERTNSFVPLPMVLLVLPQ